MYPEKSNLYRMPWSMNDNPIGWVEVTDVCNIKCKGCYRLIMGEGHKSLDQIKEEILFLKKWRNCDNITLAGGEPLLHPDITEIIKFISGMKLKSIILSNGLALTESMLKRLKESGLTGISFHIDSTQIRPEFKKQEISSELDLNDLRLKYARMLYKFGIYAHFGITVTERSLAEVPLFIEWAVENMKMINGISLIIYRGLPVAEGVEYYAQGKKVDIRMDSLGYTDETEKIGKPHIKAQDVYAKIKEHFPDYDASSYLGGTIDHRTFKWLLGSIIVNGKGKMFGAFGKKTLEIAQTFHHLFYGTYFVYPEKRIGKKVFLMLLFDKSVRKAFYKFLKYVLLNPIRIFYPINAFGIGIIQAPDILPDGRIEMCDDCPDMCVHDGMLVNSCRLDECRIYGSFLHIHVDKEKHPEMPKQSADPVES